MHHVFMKKKILLHFEGSGVKLSSLIESLQEPLYRMKQKSLSNQNTNNVTTSFLVWGPTRLCGTYKASSPLLYLK
jgi:hypothetical protein